VSVGTDLATARSRAGLTLSQVSQRTRIRQAIVAEIEQDDFSGCGGDFYARGHIRAIARAEGLDPEPLILEYDASHGLPPAGTAGRTGVEVPAAPLQIKPHRAGGWRIPLLTIGAAVVAAVVGLASYHFVTAGPTAAPRRAASQHGAASGGHRPPPGRHPGGRPTAPATALHAPAGLVITVAAVSEPCWVELTTAGGAPIFVGIIGPGTSRTWTRRRPALLHLGNPGAVTLTVNGARRAGLGPQPVMLHLRPGQETRDHR
jgi:hypothetical protein